jgi:uncharacterized protein (UPF0262 family)
MALTEIRIDDHTWDDASAARRVEWRGCIAELLDPARNVFHPDARRLEVTVTEQASLLDLHGEVPHGAPPTVLVSVRVPRDVLKALIHEYVDIVRQIAREEGPGGLARLEALDMAKKVVHDKAARVVRRHCRELRIDHDTSRRLFTLLLSLRVDTTRLVGVHGHRRVR